MKSSIIKRCNTCGRFLSKDDFKWNDKIKGYRASQCKKCTKVINALLRDKSKSKDYNKQYRVNNKKQLKQYYKKWYIDNKESLKQQMKQYNKQYYKDNKQTVDIKNKQYRKDNPEKMAAYYVKYNRTKNNQTPDLTKEEQNKIDRLYEIRDLLNHDKIDFHVDHIQPLSKGGLHHPDNLQILPNWLNQQKSDKWPLIESKQIKYEGFRI